MSIAKVAQKAGVSQATVSYVINKKPGISEQTIAKVNQVIKELGYVPRPSRTRSGLQVDDSKLKTANIGFAMPDDAMSHSQLNSSLFEAIHKELEARSLRLVPIRVSRSSGLQEAIANKTLSNVDGLIFFYYNSFSHLEKLPSIPFVSILGHPDPIQPLLCDHVEPDNTRVGAIAAKYLAEKGHRHIGVIKPSTQKHVAMDLRAQAFETSAEFLGVSSEQYHIPLDLRDAETGYMTSVTDEHPLAKWIEEYKSATDKPTGIFVPSDSHLAIVFNAFRRAGVEPGRDVDFIGCNNESMLLQGLSPMPATIDIKPDQIARNAINILVQRIVSAKTNDISNTTTYVAPSLVEFEG